MTLARLLTLAERVSTMRCLRCKHRWQDWQDIEDATFLGATKCPECESLKTEPAYDDEGKRQPAGWYW